MENTSIDYSYQIQGETLPFQQRVTQEQKERYGSRLEEILADKILHSSYEEYVSWVRDARVHKRIGTIDVSELQIDSITLERETFQNIKDLLRSAQEEFELGVKQLQEQEEIDEMLGNYRPDYRIVLNGNFPKRNKATLSEADKVLHNVQGLPPEAYDIYYDEKAGRFTTVYYDIGTSNEFFWKFRNYLMIFGREKGIPLNPNVCLIVFDRSLLGIDTDKELSIEMQRRCLEEAEINPWFYYREIARTEKKDGTGVSRYEMTIASYTFIWLYCQCINTFREQMRQSGKTYDMQHAGGYEFSIGSRNTKALIIHFKQEEAGKNRSAMIHSANIMPKFCRLHNIKRRIQKGKEYWVDGADMKVGDKTKIAENEWCRNILKTVAVGKTESSASQAGRGDTVPIVFGDEMNYIGQIIALLTAVTYANSMASKLAEKSGRRYGMHFASTAGELNHEAGKIMYKMTHEGMCQWIPELLGYGYQDLVQYMRSTAERNMMFFSYQYDALGFGEDSFEKAWGDSANEMKFLQEFMNRWNSSSKDSIYGVQHMNRIEKISAKQIHANYLYAKYNRIIYFPENTQTKFPEFLRQTNVLHIGIDIAAGNSQDSSVMFGIDLETAKPIFAFKNNTILVHDFAFLVGQFVRHLKELHPNLKIIISPESDGGVGQTFIPILAKDPFVEPMIFRVLKFYNKAVMNTMVKSTTKSIDSDKYVQYGTSMRASFGGISGGKETHRNWLTTTLLTQLIERHPYAICWRDAFLEVTTLVKTAKGRIQAAVGEHDDCIIAVLHAYAPIFDPFYRENLERFWNFVVDFNKIKYDPIGSSIIAEQQIKEHNDVEGKVEFTMVTRRNAYGDEWDEITVTKVINGVRITLSEEEGMNEILHHPEHSHDPRILNMRLRPIRLEPETPLSASGFFGESNRRKTSYHGESLSVTGIGRTKKGKYKSLI